MDMFKTISGRLSTFTKIFLLMSALVVITSAQTSGVDLSFNTVLEKNLASASSTDFILQPDDKIIVFGPFQSLNGAVSNGVARLNPDGTGDNTFNCTACDFPVTSAAVQSDGKIIIAGGIIDDIGRTQPRIYRLNVDGSRDTSFTSPYPPVTGIPPSGVSLKVLTVQSDGKILVQANSVLVNGHRFEGVGRLLPAGPFDNSFTSLAVGESGITYSNHAGQISLLPDGKILAILNYGPHFGPGSGTIQRYNTDGTVDTTFQAPTISSGTSSVDYGYTIGFDLLPDGSIIMAGHFSTVNAVNQHNVAKLLPAGNVDLSFNITNIADDAKTVKILPDGKFIVGTSNRLYRFNPDSSPDPTFATPSDLSPISNWTLDSTGKVVVFSLLGSLARFARLNDDGSVAFQFTLMSGTAASATAVAQQPDGRIVFAGDFARINGVPRVSIARVNTDGSLDTTFNSGTGFNGSVSQIIVQTDGKILAAGNFTNYNGVPRPAIARINADGSLDSTFDPGLSPATFSTIALQPDGKILIGGTSGTVNGTPRTGVARLNSDGSLDTNFNPIFGTPSIVSIAVQSDGKIMVGGSFNGVNGFNRKNLVRLAADGTVDGPFIVADNSINTFGLRQIELRSDGKYYILTNNTAVRLNNDGSTDAAFISPEFSGTVNRLLAQSDGSILAGGDFTLVNNTSSLRLARIGPYGSLDSTFLPAGANGNVRAIVKQTDGRILVGGDFSMIGNVTRWGISRLNVAPHNFKTAFDFDGDGRADVAVFRPSDGNWYELLSHNNSFSAFHFGQQNDRIAAADYDGDGRTDVAVFRDTIPGAGNFAYFFMAYSADNSYAAVQFGSTGDVPVSGDWDGDGKADLAVYRDGNLTGGQSYFFYRPSGTPGVNFRAVSWGAAGDRPLSGDFDGDGIQDAAVFRPSNSYWYILKSSNNQTTQQAFGVAGDIPVPADYDGDGTTNIAVFRPSTGNWYTSTDVQTNYGAVHFGVTGDVPTPADYDGDGKADVAVFRPSNGVWYMLRSTQGFTAVQFGVSSDKAVPNAFIR